MSGKPAADVGTTIHPCLTLYSLMKQCKSQIFNTTHHWARGTTASLDFTKAKESYAYAKGDYVSMRKELENSNWLRTYTALIEQTSIEDKWLYLKSMLIEQKENFVLKQSNHLGRIKGVFLSINVRRKRLKPRTKHIEHGCVQLCLLTVNQVV